MLISFRLGFAGIDLSNILQVCNSIIYVLSKNLLFLFKLVLILLHSDNEICVLGFFSQYVVFGEEVFEIIAQVSSSFS